MKERRFYGKRLLLLIVIVFAMFLSPVQGSLAVFQDSTSIINNDFFVEEPTEKTAQEPTEESSTNVVETKSANEVDEQAVNEVVDGSESQQESDNLTNVNEANHEPIEIYADADISTGEVIIPLSSFSFTPDIDTLDWHEDASAISSAVIKEDNLVVTVAFTVLEQYGRVISGYITDSNNESSGNIYIRIVNSSK